MQRNITVYIHVHVHTQYIIYNNVYIYTVYIHVNAWLKETHLNLLLCMLLRTKQVMSEAVSAAVQKEVGAAMQEQMAKVNPEARLEEERKKKQVRKRRRMEREGGRERQCVCVCVCVCVCMCTCLCA